MDRCDKIGVSMAEVCAYCDVSYKMVKKYYVDADEALSRPKLRATHIQKVAKVVGIDIRVVGVLKNEMVDRKKILSIGFIRG